MENFEFDSEMGGYVVPCHRCGTSAGVRANYLCDPCDKVWNLIDGPLWDDHLDLEPSDSEEGGPMTTTKGGVLR